ncbi:MAG: hypothetical protein AAF411_32090, partial [Myxococcota bacterium]
MKRLLAALLVAACGSSNPATSTPEITAATELNRVERERFNQVALREGIPIHWYIDRDNDGSVDPDEVHALHFYTVSREWTAGDQFTSDFFAAYAAIEAAASEGAPSDARLAAVRTELESTAPTLVYSDLRELPDDQRAFAGRMIEVGRLIDALYATQVGASALTGRVAEDAASQSLFRRNWGAHCRSPLTESIAACSAIEGGSDQPVDVYPMDMQADPSFCEALQADGVDEEIMAPFTVVRRDGMALRAVPYTEAYADEMGAIAATLRLAINDLPAAEEALKAYLESAASAFTTNDWFSADAAWAAMDATNSRWYVRVGPDEVYWDPCNRKAGFHLTFALIDRSSLEWQAQLNPLRADMEGALASLVDSYDPRNVNFAMPDFIAIVANFGDDRDPYGATIGQSLPNWGPVATSGGRTVAMSTLYNDADSLQRRRRAAAALLDDASIALLSDSTEGGLMSTILHEAGHNLGPAHSYEVNGQTASQAFGGELATMLEELKAQSSALFFIDMLRERGVINDE